MTRHLKKEGSLFLVYTLVVLQEALKMKMLDKQQWL
jgi:hypothetical protein